MKLSIVIPAHNEEHRISPTLDVYLPYFSKHYGSDFELIVVVNGATDGTERVVRNHIESIPQLHVVVEPRKVGKGGAVIRGMDTATGDLIGYVDADGSTPPEAFDALVCTCYGEGCDGAIASRWLKGADVSPKQSALRQFTSRTFNFATHVLFGMRYADTQCGAKVFKAAPIRKVLPRMGLTRWAFDVDLLFQLQRDKAIVREIPTTWHDVEGSKLAVTEASVEMLLALVRLRLMYSPFRGIVKVLNRWFPKAFGTYQVQ
jgi:glycosyltransferase involved in cell wall biosynthesis